MQPSDADETPGPGEYTIDELAARSGVPSRTIRFYQAKGVLPPPRFAVRLLHAETTRRTVSIDEC